MILITIGSIVTILAIYIIYKDIFGIRTIAQSYITVKTKEKEEQEKRIAEKTERISDFFFILLMLAFIIMYLFSSLTIRTKKKKNKKEESN